MIRISHEKTETGDITAPIFVCDECHLEIEDCQMANMLWEYEHPHIQFHIHKHCNHRFESRAPQKLFPWWPLDQFLDFLCHNAKLSNAKKDRQFRHEMWKAIAGRTAKRKK